MNSKTDNSTCFGLSLGKTILLTLLGGFVVLLVDIRFEHGAALLEGWHAWIPLVFCMAMIVLLPLGLFFWKRGGRIALSVCFALAILVGTLGVWLHSDGKPLAAFTGIAKVCMREPRSSDWEEGSPPVMAPFAFIGLGILGLLVCSTGVLDKGSE